jgi:hypothetical protein
MRLFFLYSIVLFLIGCNKSSKQQSVAPANINTEAPYLWANYTTPKTLKISNDFYDDEVQNITDMTDEWELVLENKKNFFTIGARINETTNDLGSLDQLYDNTLGIYKTMNWPNELPGSALAVTQVFGRRYNTGTASEFVNIEHADILINDDIHDFDTTDTGINYDLRTVILHELGHFLGLQHKALSYNRASSIMYPSITSSEYKRSPLPIDISDMAEKYQISLSSGGAGMAMSVGRARPRYQIPSKSSGEPVKILLELHADGSCVHRWNGLIKRIHSLEKK